MMGNKLMIKKPKKIKKKLTPEEKALAKQLKIKNKYIADIKSIFINAGFTYIKTEGKEFTFSGRTGEIDSLYVYENVIIVCEDTYAENKPHHHLQKKKIIFDLIDGNKEEFVNFLIATFDSFKNLHNQSGLFQPHHYEVRIAYFSRYAISEETLNQFQNISYFDYPRFRYFSSLNKITGKTSRFELFKFFKLEFSKIGEIRVKGGLPGNIPYEGFLLPEANSRYPAGYKVLSFYIDPQTLLQKSHVLRKDSWQDPDSTYQRMLEPKKIRDMRKYLNDTQRVYVNNLIVTLPSTTTFTSPKNNNQIIVDGLKDKQHVKINLPDEYNSIGLIDGQHRVYSYHEGTDVYENTIEKLRTCQNLLVTAIMYPPAASEDEKAKFEATLFLEINDKQTKAKGELKQGIELLVRPFSTAAISKAVVTQLAKLGPLSGELMEHYFDEEYKIRTSSIVSYGLAPLVSLGGKESLINIWNHQEKNKVISFTDKNLLNEYIKFCVTEINNLLIAVKLNLQKDQWSREYETSLLSTTSVNGFLVCLRELVRANSLHDIETYKQKLIGIESFNFKNFKSSHWKALGLKLYETYLK
jgi:DGQHR domain-containing protein